MLNIYFELEHPDDTSKPIDVAAALIRQYEHRIYSDCTDDALKRSNDALREISEYLITYVRHNQNYE